MLSAEGMESLPLMNTGGSLTLILALDRDPFKIGSSYRAQVRILSLMIIPLSYQSVATFKNCGCFSVNIDRCFHP